MDAAQRRSLKAQAHHLKCRMTIGKAGVNDPIIETIRRHFDHVELIKIRMAMDDAGEVDLAGAEIASRVPCEFVGRVGHVGIFHRPKSGGQSPSGVARGEGDRSPL